MKDWHSRIGRPYGRAFSYFVFHLSSWSFDETNLSKPGIAVPLIGSFELREEEQGRSKSEKSCIDLLTLYISYIFDMNLFEA